MSNLKKVSKRILGIDYGIKRMGLALSDERQMIACPLETFHCEPKAAQTLSKLLAAISQICLKYQCEIEKIVIGLPLMMSGLHGLVADEVQRFIEALRKECPIEIETWDERLTTVQAERSLKSNEMNRKKRTKVVDVVSAAIILQSFLDHQNRHT